MCTVTHCTHKDNDNMYFRKSPTAIWVVCLIVLGVIAVSISHPPVSQAANNPPVMPTPVVSSAQNTNTRAATDLKKIVVGSSWMLGILQNDTLVSWGDNRFWQSTIPTPIHELRQI